MHTCLNTTKKFEEFFYKKDIRIGKKTIHCKPT